MTVINLQLLSSDKSIAKALGLHIGRVKLNGFQGAGHMKRATKDRLITLAKLLVLDKKSIATVKWILSRGDSTLRLQYPLAANSIVFDIGGYVGDWSAEISKRYNPSIHIFEPVDVFYNQIEQMSVSKPKLILNKFGLSNKTEVKRMSIDDDGSSVIKNDGQLAEIKLVDIFEYVTSNNIEKIDLIKINIEGGEYPLLERMIEKDLISRCTDIQVQFHDFYPDAIESRNRIRSSLTKTHVLTYNFDFIWENWKKRS